MVAVVLRPPKQLTVTVIEASNAGCRLTVRSLEIFLLSQTFEMFFSFTLNRPCWLQRQMDFTLTTAKSPAFSRERGKSFSG